jgi:hypothetical protein
MTLESKLHELKKDHEELKRVIDQSIQRLKMTFFGMTFVQFCFFYHCIFNIEWLGWDIMEPITYSVEVLKFLVLLRFFYMYRKDGDLEGIYSVMLNRFCQKNPVVGNKLSMIEERIEEIKQKLQVIYDYDFIQN